MNSAINMKNVLSEKDLLTPEKIEKKNPSQIKDLEQFSRCLIERTKLIHDRLNSFDKKKYNKKKKKIEGKLEH